MSNSNPTLLQINASIFGAGGHSSRLSNDFVAQWQRNNPSGQVTVRDLGAQPLPHFDAAYVEALGTVAGERSSEQAQRVALADQLIDEVKSAQTLVIGLPMYNFGIPSQLKAWIDYVTRAKTTFHYTATGPQGLAGDRPTILFATRGGQYRDTPTDSQIPYMHTVLNFLGIHDIRTVYAERLASNEHSTESLERARDQALALFASSDSKAVASAVAG